jgi:hypothetical protein
MTTEPAPFALSPDGVSLVCCDGPELLVYRSDGTPLWKQFTDGILIGVAFVGPHVITLDSEGRLTRWRLADGTVFETMTVPGDVRGLAVDPTTGAAAALTPSGPILMVPGAPPRPVPAPGAAAVAFGPGGASLAVGTEGGQLTALELATGAAWGTLQLQGPIRAITWCALGSWLVGAGEALARVQGDAQALQVLIPAQGGPVRAVTTTADGLAAAAQIGDDTVAVYELFSSKRLGEIVVRRRIGGVTFGAGTQLGIGLDDGDATVVDIVSGKQARTEPHPGRGRNTWRVENRVEGAGLRGAMAFHKAGEQPIARYVPPPDPEDEGGGGGCLGGCLGVLGLVLFLSLFCAGVVGLMYFLRAYGLWEFIPIR